MQKKTFIILLIFLLLIINLVFSKKKESTYIDILYKEKKIDKDTYKMLKKAGKDKISEIEKMLSLNDEELLETIQKRTFTYFWDAIHPKTGLMRDRATNNGLCSIAVVGFGLSAIPIGIERGWITKEEGYDRVLKILNLFDQGVIEGKEGFYYHWVNVASGWREWDSELSSIDTTLLVAGVIFVGEYFKDTEIEKIAEKIYKKVNWQWMLSDGEFLSMGWTHKNGYLQATWSSFDEGLLATFLAIASPTHPIPVSTWDQIIRPINKDHISYGQEVLFVYQYPQCWLDLRNKEDKYANYFNNTKAAIKYNRDYVIANSANYKTYEENIWGLSASDGPRGYKAYGAAPNNHDGTIIPNVTIAALPHTPELSIKAIRTMLEKYGPLIWGKYGFMSAFNIDKKWISKDYVGIDQGNYLLMIENYRSGLIWKYFMRNKYVQTAMKKIGFKKSRPNTIITASYKKEYESFMKQNLEAKNLKASKKKDRISVDGDLSEWGGVKGYLVSEDMPVLVPGIRKVNKDKHVLHSTFYIQWDEQYLYLAAKVADDVLISNLPPNIKSRYYFSDSIEFYIDTLRSNGSSIFKLAVLPFDLAGNVQATRHEDTKPGPIKKTSPGTKVASLRTDGGYNIEVAIPFEDLGLIPAAGISFGLSHTLHGTSNTNAGVGHYVRTHILSWNNIPEVWHKPSAWSQLVLE